ncbi:NAD(P)-dependent oxidoreductase [Vibrio nomapromontoriensis]|uniref:NAD(P)-dependent oxidoreductase n=1 Tax=Vibrio nomapromontoriensis TaxID=2910246 RepID=UPI003D147442
MKLYIHPVLNNDEKAYFSDQADARVELIFNDGTNEFSRCQHCEVAIGNFDTDWIERMGNLTTILLDSVGTDNFNNFQWPSERKISVHNLNDFFSVPVAEEALASVLSVYRQLPALREAQRQGRWIKDELRPLKRLMSGEKVLLVGYGNIGQRLEQLLTVFNCQITTFNKQDMELGGKENLIRKVSESDIIFSTIPATPETHEIFNREVFSAMPKGATFLNVGRGQVVDEFALCDKAKADSSFNACLDVTVQEPINQDSELWQLPNIHLTQHTGGGSLDENYKKIDSYISQINRLLSSEPLINTIQF